MGYFDYINGVMHAELVNIKMMAKEVGTPFYCYSNTMLEEGYCAFADAFSDISTMICYAVKANSNQAVLATLGNLGCGADVVSKGELQRALAAGLPSNRIVFSGVGKTNSDLDAALHAHIYCFNVESVDELQNLSHRAVLMGKKAPVSLRVNPDIDSKTHEKISTGKAIDKFGIAWNDVMQVYELATTLPGIEITGIDMHIGSQIMDLEPFERAFAKLASLAKMLMTEGYTIRHVDLGGGLGISYSEYDLPLARLKDYAQIVKKHTRELNCKVILEPGRIISGNAGILVGEVIYLKPGEDRTFIIGNVAMNDLIRPTLYNAWHEVYPVCETILKQATQFGDLVGPICESGDFMARGRNLPALKKGDLYVIKSAGAYGAVLASTYNSRPLIPEVLVKNDSYYIIRPRLDPDKLIAMDRIPDWLA